MKLVRINEIFSVHYGINLELNSLSQVSEDQGIPFVSRTSKNNGVSAYVKVIDNLIPNPAHTLSVAGGGSVLETFYQEKPYYSGRDLYFLVPLTTMDKKEMLIYCTLISSNKYRYNFGRQANKTLGNLLVPSPQEVKKITKKISIPTYPSKNSCSNEHLDIHVGTWKQFNIQDDLFTITGSKTTSLSKLEDYGKGKYPYVTTQATNNGIYGFYDYYTEEGGVLTVDSAVLGYCAYQELPFSASDHVEKLIPKFKMNKYIAMFLVTILNLEQYRYNYGRKSSQTRIKLTNIKLPAKLNSTTKNTILTGNL